METSKGRVINLCAIGRSWAHREQLYVSVMLSRLSVTFSPAARTHAHLLTGMMEAGDGEISKERTIRNDWHR